MNSNYQLTSADSRSRIKVSIITLLIGILVLGFKFYAFQITQSKAIYSDAMESIVNVLTAAMGIYVIYFSSQPVDDDHPYGHGKAEYLSAAFEGGLITFASLVVIVSAVRAIKIGASLYELETGMVFIIIAGLVNLLFGIFLKKFGRKNNSLALVASGTHLITDFWTTLGALVGILLVKITGLVILDSVVALLLGFHMAATGLSLVTRSASGLLDSEDPSILLQLAKIFENHAKNGIIQIHHTKVIRSGWFHHIDAHVVVPEFWTVDVAHHHLEIFEKAVIKEYAFSGEANFHLDPCQKNYCSVCDLKDCPVRVKAFERRMPVKLEHLRSKNEPEEFRKLI